MTLFFREQRVARPASPEQRYSLADIGQMAKTYAGSYADIDLSFSESPLQDVAYHAGVSLVASLASELPLSIYRGDGVGARTVPIPGHLEDPGGEGYGREDWTYQFVVSRLTAGNAFGNVLDRDGSNRPTQVELLHPDLPRPQIDGNGRLRWYVRGQEVTDMWHTRSYPYPGNVLGLSPIQQHANSFRLAIATTRFGVQWFEEGAVPATVLHNEERTLTTAMAQTVKDRFVAAIRGKREPVVLDRGWKLDQVQIAPEESQFLQTQQFGEAQCARIVGPGVAELLGYETGGNLTYSNRLDRMADFSTLTLNRWIKAVERVYQAMLPPNRIPRIDRDALLETLTKDRYESYALALAGVPWMKPSEVRPKEGLPPDPALDKPDVPEGGTDVPVTQ